MRGEYGHDIVDTLQPRGDEPVVDKPGKGSFYATDLDAILKSKGITSQIALGYLVLGAVIYGLSRGAAAVPAPQEEIEEPTLAAEVS